MLISYRATVAYRQRFCLECNLGSCPFMFNGCIPHHLNIKCQSPPPLTYIISRLELSRVSFQGRLISTSKKRNINYQSFTDVIIGGAGVSPPWRQLSSLQTNLSTPVHLYCEMHLYYRRGRRNGLDSCALPCSCNSLTATSLCTTWGTDVDMASHFCTTS